MKHKILLIEDTAIIRLSIRNCLEKAGMEVIELARCEDFMKWPHLYSDVNLLILDVILPGIDGVTFLEELRKDTSFATLPVIILTGHPDEDTLKRAIRAGAVDFIRKPYSEADLLARINKILGVLSFSGQKADSEVATIVRKEVLRASRGKTAVAFLEIEPPSLLRSLAKRSELIGIKEQVSQRLREIDSSLITSRHNLFLILPLTNRAGAKVVINKIGTLINDAGSTVSLAVFPDDGDTADKLMAKLHDKAGLDLQTLTVG